MTTKHHEGFCPFDSKYTGYKSTNTKAADQPAAKTEYTNTCYRVYLTINLSVPRFQNVTHLPRSRTSMHSFAPVHEQVHFLLGLPVDHLHARGCLSILF
nr:alpha-L-fucosidase [Niastella populi]